MTLFNNLKIKLMMIQIMLRKNKIIFYMDLT